MNKYFTMSALARLLAGENIAVIHSPTRHTAMFDLSKRHLILPVWKDMSPDLYDLLLTHEIGHALYTPIEGWHSSLTNHKNGRAFKGFLNVVEDVRIERLIKAKYPGLNRTFFTAYKELMDQDFFGLKKNDVDINELTLIDRLNIHAKCGHTAAVQFSAAEQLLVDEAFACETFDEVSALANRLYKLQQRDSAKTKNPVKFDEFLKALRDSGSEGTRRSKIDIVPEEDTLPDDYKQLPSSPDRDYVAPEENSEPGDLESSGAIAPGPAGSVDGNNFDSLEPIDPSDQFKHTSSDDDLSPSVKEIEAQLDSLESEEEPTSLTDDSFHEAEETLASGAHGYGNDEKILIIDDLDMSKFMVPAEKVNAHIKHERDSEMFFARFNRKPNIPTRASLAQFLRDEQKIINQLATEFEMRQNAAQYARAGSAKTGVIDMKRLHAARLSDDIFQRIMKVPEGKSHAMMMFFDQSQSMSNIYAKTLEQIIVLVEFCRRMAIPFEVYGFNSINCSREAYFGFDGYSHPTVPTPGRVGLNNKFIHLKQYIHSSMSTSQYNEALYNLWTIRSHDNRFFSESLDYCTPMNQAIILSGQLVKKMKLKTKVDVINCVFLTDGDATDSIGTNSGGMAMNSGSMRIAYNGMLSDKMKQDYANISTVTAGLSKFMGSAAGANYIGVFIPFNKIAAKKAITRYHTNRILGGKTKAAKYTIEKDGFFMTENFGFDSFFIVKPINDKEVATLATDLSSQSAAQIARSFSKVAVGRVQQRAFLSVFATQIAE